METTLMIFVGLLLVIIAVAGWNVYTVLRNARNQNYGYRTDENGVEHVIDSNDD